MVYAGYTPKRAFLIEIVIVFIAKENKDLGFRGSGVPYFQTNTFFC